MTFFEPLPPMPDLGEAQPTGWRPPVWDRPSEATLGAVVPMSVLLAKTDRVAVALGDVVAYPNGFTFNIVIIGNPMTPRPPDQYGMFPMGRGGPNRGPRIGFEFADGARASDTSPRPSAGTMMMIRAQRDEQGIPTTPVLTPQGGGGGSNNYQMRYWCFPLPPPGALDLYLEWVDHDIPETKVTLDADAIRAAAANAIILWEPEP